MPPTFPIPMASEVHRQEGNGISLTVCLPSSGRALPVLFSALSEHGQFTDMGKQVHSSGAVYVFVAAIESILSQVM